MAVLPMHSNGLRLGQVIRKLLFLLIILFLHEQPVQAAGPAVGSAENVLTLEQAERLFMQHNREILAARRNAEGAEADTLSAAAAPNPDLTIGTSRISPSLGIGAGRLADKRMDTVIGLSQVFERGNKRELRTETARFRAAAARSDESDVVRQQLLNLRLAYYDLLLSQEKLEVATTTAALFEKSVDAAGRRLAAGDISAADLSRIQVDALRARNDARATQAELDRNRIALAYLVGSGIEARRIVAAGPWPAESAAGAPPAADLIEQRADVRAARARVAAAEKNRDLARALRTRDITAGVQFERFPGDTANNSYGFTVSIPIMARNQYTGEIRRAEVELEAAKEDLERIRAVAQDEIRRADGELSAALERSRRLLDVLLPAAGKAAAAAEFAHERGAIGVMDLLDARRQLYAARIEAATAKADHARALAARRSATTVIPD